MLHLQRHGKFYFDVSYWGPRNVRTKMPAEITPAVLDYIIGSWLIGNLGLSALFLGPNECTAACFFPSLRGNMPNYSQFFAAVGSPTSPPVGPTGAERTRLNPTLAEATIATTGLSPAGCEWVWSRNYTKAVIYVNPKPVGPSSQKSHLTGEGCVVSTGSASKHTRLDGVTVVAPSRIALPAASAVVLLRA